jgi:hypothetical protein
MFAMLVLALLAGLLLLHYKTRRRFLGLPGAGLQLPIIGHYQVSLLLISHYQTRQLLSDH